MVQLRSTIGPHRELCMATKYFDISKFSHVAGEDMLLFGTEGIQLQIINVFDGQSGFGHRTELSALRKMMEILQSESPKWSRTELMVIKQLCESMSKYVWVPSLRDETN